MIETNKIKIASKYAYLMTLVQNTQMLQKQSNGEKEPKQMI